MAAKFTIFKDKASKFRFRLIATNGEIIAVGEAYNTKAACMNGIKSIRKNAPTAALIDETVKAADAAGKKATGKKAAGKKAAGKKAAGKKAAGKKAARKKAAK
ncbi:MAG: YegP family protein [Spirochaetota bacterium]|jgi:uncharacterized protein YegP (UPF0339 family)|nr:YegP family protein [Spirochaetota bacterium]